MFVRPVQTCLQLSIFIILAQVSFRSLLCLSPVSQLSKLTWQDRRSLKYFVLLQQTMCNAMCNIPSQNTVNRWRGVWNGSAVNCDTETTGPVNQFQVIPTLTFSMALYVMSHENIKSARKTFVVLNVPSLQSQYFIKNLIKDDA